MKYYQYILEPLEYIPARESFIAIRAVCKAANKRLTDAGMGQYYEGDPCHYQSIAESDAYAVYWGLSGHYQSLIRVTTKEGEL